MAEGTSDSSIPTTTGAGATERPDDQPGSSTANTGGAAGSASSIPTTTGEGATEGEGAGSKPTTSDAKGTLPTSGE